MSNHLRDAELARRAALYRQRVLDAACGPGGMIISFVRFDSGRPFQEGEPGHWYLESNLEEVWGTDSPRPTLAEWLYGENTLWATGWLLWSELLRYRVTGEAEAAETARKCSRDLSRIFRIGRAIEPGLLGKPHGGCAGPTTSFDQAANPVVFYAMYAGELATAGERAEAKANLAEHGHWYLRRDWVMNHHGNLSRIVPPSHPSVMKYLACVHAAYEATGDQTLRDAALHQLRQLIGRGVLPFPSDPYETNHNLFYWAFLCDYWSRTEASADADWDGCIRAYWRAARAALDERGLLRMGLYAHAAGTFTPYPTRWLTPADRGEWPSHAPRKPGGRRWLSATSHGNRSLNAALMAALALLVRARGLDEDGDAARRAQGALLTLSEDSLRWWWDDGSLPADLLAVTNLFAPEVAGAWLAAYWLGRTQGLWTP